LTFVLDNSVALAWSFRDERTPVIMELLAAVEGHGAFAPAIWPLEALNGLLMAERRGRIGPEMRASLVLGLRQLPVELDEETTEQAWDVTTALAACHRLTVYDATYLELALRRRLPLATLDRALRDAAAREGVTLLGLEA
jgi:predicted nucleic acid-binding protein